MMALLIVLLLMFLFIILGFKLKSWQSRLVWGILLAPLILTT
jgi:hypothetical protein